MGRKRRVIGVLAVTLLPVCSSCEGEWARLSRQTEGLYIAGQVPVGLSRALPAHQSGVPTELVSLGRQLFFDVRLSSDRSRSCATCHDPARAFTDGRSLRDAGRARNTPTLLNAALRRTFGWDGSASTLAERVQLELMHPSFLGGDPREIEALLRDIRGYRRQFGALFGQVTMQGVVRALEAFIGTLLSGASPYDLAEAGYGEAIPASARRGLALFFGKARCGTCHAGPLFTDESFHNVGVGTHRATGDRAAPDRATGDGLSGDESIGDGGRMAVTGQWGDWGAFRTPSLRDVAVTGPYMHDGSLGSLEEVVAFFERGGSVNPNLDAAIEPLDLTRQEAADLIDFLKALTGDRPLVEPGLRPE
ncbi:MAG: cytochrome c peroxidase [Planctomycetota bacterium]